MCIRDRRCCCPVGAAADAGRRRGALRRSVHSLRQRGGGGGSGRPSVVCGRLRWEPVRSSPWVRASGGRSSAGGGRSWCWAAVWRLAD
eukprot:12893951-Alexandrium_andersonii.AAC.1